MSNDTLTPETRKEVLAHVPVFDLLCEIVRRAWDADGVNITVADMYELCQIFDVELLEVLEKVQAVRDERG